VIGFSLSDALLEIQSRAREFAQSEILPLAVEYDRKAEVPPGLAAKAKAAGLLNVTIPKEYGGMSYGALQSAIIAEELGAACVGISITILVNGLALTPIQMAGMMAAVANGGTRYKPLILESIKTADGRLIYQNQPQITGKIPLNARALELVRKGLWEVVNSDRGTARGSRLVDIDISGKTGTSQVVSRKKDDTQPEDEKPAHLRPHAWFVAYAPSDRPQIAIAVLVEHGEHGSGAAAPIAREMIKTYLRKDWPINQMAKDRDRVAEEGESG